MTIAAYALKSYTACRTCIGSLSKTAGSMVMKPKCSPDCPDDIIFSVVWVIKGPTRGVTPVYGACVPSKSTTNTSSEDRFCSTWNSTPQYKLKTTRMNTQRIKATKESARDPSRHKGTLVYLFSPTSPAFEVSPSLILSPRNQRRAADLVYPPLPLSPPAFRYGKRHCCVADGYCSGIDRQGYDVNPAKS